MNKSCKTTNKTVLPDSARYWSGRSAPIQIFQSNFYSKTNNLII